MPGVAGFRLRPTGPPRPATGALRGSARTTKHGGSWTENAPRDGSEGKNLQNTSLAAPPCDNPQNAGEEVKTVAALRGEAASSCLLWGLSWGPNAGAGRKWTFSRRKPGDRAREGGKRGKSFREKRGRILKFLRSQEGGGGLQMLLSSVFGGTWVPLFACLFRVPGHAEETLVCAFRFLGVEPPLPLPSPWGEKKTLAFGGIRVDFPRAVDTLESP